MKPPPKPPRPLPARPGGTPDAGARPAAPATRKPRILVVDDDPDIGRLLRLSLQKDYEVAVAANGAEALLAVRTQPAFELILLDVMMPGMEGFDVAHRIRALPGSKRTPILFLTARDTPLDRIHAIQAGARSYLTKPFKLDELLDRIRGALGH